MLLLEPEFHWQNYMGGQSKPGYTCVVKSLIGPIVAQTIDAAVAQIASAVGCNPARHR